VLLHPLDGEINHQLLPKESHRRSVYLPNDDVVRPVESIPNLTKVVRIGL
jgi:hypothetical protein